MTNDNPRTPADDKSAAAAKVLRRAATLARSEPTHCTLSLAIFAGASLLKCDAIAVLAAENRLIDAAAETARAALGESCLYKKLSPLEVIEALERAAAAIEAEGRDK